MQVSEGHIDNMQVTWTSQPPALWGITARSLWYFVIAAWARTRSELINGAQKGPSTMDTSWVLSPHAQHIHHSVSSSLNILSTFPLYSLIYIPLSTKIASLDPQPQSLPEEIPLLLQNHHLHEAFQIVLFINE